MVQLLLYAGILASGAGLLPQVAYASLRPEFELELEDGEDPMEAIKKAKELCHEAMTTVLGLDDQRNDAIKSLNQLRRDITRWEKYGAEVRVKTKEQAQLFEDIVKKMYPDSEPTQDESVVDSALGYIDGEI